MGAMKHTPLTLFGIAHCDTVRKARAWLAAQGQDCVFHDFGKQGVPPEHLALWVGQLGWEALLNRRGTTWRKLPPDEQERVQDAASAMALMQAHPSVIKRPVAEWPQQGGQPRATVGFDAALWAEWAKA